MDRETLAQQLYESSDEAFQESGGTIFLPPSQWEELSDESFNKIFCRNQAEILIKMWESN